MPDFKLPGYGSLTLEKPTPLTSALSQIDPLQPKSVLNILPSLASLLPIVGPFAGPILTGILGSFGTSAPSIEEQTFSAISELTEQVQEGFNNLSNLVASYGTEILSKIEQAENLEIEFKNRLAEKISSLESETVSTIRNIREKSLSRVQAEIVSRQVVLTSIKNQALSVIADNYKYVQEYSYSVLLKSYYKAGLQQLAEEIQDKKEQVDRIVLYQKARVNWAAIYLRLEEFIPPLVEKILLRRGYHRA